MGDTKSTRVSRRELLAAAGKAGAMAVVASPLVRLAYGNGGELFAQALPADLNAVAGPDRVVMNHGTTYLNAWAGYGPLPRRDRRRPAAPEQSPPGAPAPAPPPAPRTTWSKVSGPGTVTFADPGAAVTTATFSVPGDYVVQVVADNGTARATSALAVKVELPPPPTQLTPVVTRLHTVTDPFWASHQGADHLVDPALRRRDQPDGHPGRPRRRRHRQLHRSGQGAARRAARPAQGLRLLECLGAPDGRVDLPGVDGGSPG